VWAVRHSTEHRTRTLFVSADVDSLKALHPDNPRLQRMREGDTLIVSEPFADLSGAWHEIPESTAVVVKPDGANEFRPFSPHVPAPRPRDRAPIAA
jgi:hypothetical protein